MKKIISISLLTTILLINLCNISYANKKKSTKKFMKTVDKLNKKYGNALYEISDRSSYQMTYECVYDKHKLYGGLDDYMFEKTFYRCCMAYISIEPSCTYLTEGINDLR